MSGHGHDATAHDEILAALVRFSLKVEIDAASRERARIALADTLVAMCSGRLLPPGMAAARFAAAHAAPNSGVTELALGTNVSAVDAAFCGGMLAHADETDDSHENARIHPGCSIVPAALAVAEQRNQSISDVLDAIAVGYDVAVAINVATWADSEMLRASRISTHAIGGLFGSLAAILHLQQPSAAQASSAYSYAIQHAGGSTTWLRDVDHIEKSMVFGGLPARSAVFSAELASLGFTGVPDPFSGQPNFFSVFSSESAPERIAERLNTPGLALRETTTKRYPAGMPIQAVCEAIDLLLKGELKGSSADKIGSVLIELPLEKTHIVDNSAMDDVNCQLVAALQLTTGRVDFAALHSLADRPAAVASMRERVKLVGAEALDKRNNGYDTTRIARVTVGFMGKTSVCTVVPPTGSPEKPFAWVDVFAKAHEILGSVGVKPADVDNALRLLDTKNIDSASTRELMSDICRSMRLS